MSDDLDQLAINTIRTLSIDAVQQANSGHPGTPMALAPAVYTIWNRVMNFDPEDPIWPNRDRFVLSNGHASMLLWAVLHLTGTRAVNADYERLGESAVTLDDIKRFRQLDSKAPGHPEYHWVSGVETTTGPLGQGVAIIGEFAALDSAPSVRSLNHGSSVSLDGAPTEGDLVARAREAHVLSIGAEFDLDFRPNH
jgi:transketolase